jgi:hypothetical protein
LLEEKVNVIEKEKRTVENKAVAREGRCEGARRRNVWRMIRLRYWKRQGEKSRWYNVEKC